MSGIDLLAGVWGAAARAHEAMYRSGLLRRHRLPRPSVSVGALEMGGSGKTPAVAALARLALEAGWRPAILSRGYRRRSRGAVLVSRGAGPVCSARDAGDEPAMYARALPTVPIAVAARREEAAALLLEHAEADLFVLDDAFQHRRVARDLDLLMVDPGRPFWEAQPPPAGRLRERPDAARRADGFLLVDDHTGEGRRELARRYPDRDVFDLASRQPGAVRLGADEEPGPPPQPTLPFAGIARPERLQHSLLAAGVETLPLETFPDHHWYDRADLERLRDLARRQGAASMITTSKDAVRLPDDPPGPAVWVWQYGLAIEDPDGLRARLAPLLEAGS